MLARVRVLLGALDTAGRRINSMTPRMAVARVAELRLPRGTANSAKCLF